MSAPIITLPAERSPSRIVVRRGQRVLLEADLAAIIEAIRLLSESVLPEMRRRIGFPSAAA